MILGNETVNTVFSLNSISTDLKDMICKVARDKSSCYHEYAQFHYTNSVNNLVGLQLYKDFYTWISFVYKGCDNEYHSIGITKFYKDDNNKLIPDLYGIAPSYNYKQLEQELLNLLNNNLEVIHDYDREMLEEAIASMDWQAIDDVVGDRDLCELL